MRTPRHDSAVPHLNSDVLRMCEDALWEDEAALALALSEPCFTHVMCDICGGCVECPGGGSMPSCDCNVPSL